jgi:hypothetical protein
LNQENASEEAPAKNMDTTAASRRSDPKGGRAHRLSQPRVSLGRSGDSENAAPEKVQTSTAPTTAVLGDATNTYCSGQQGLFAPIIPKLPKTNPQEQRFGGIPTPRRSVVRSDNPQNVSEYAQDILQVLKREEPEHLPSPTYMERQVHVNTRMRGILIDWLVDVHKKYKLRAETLFLAVQLIDRYLEVQVTAQRHLQLVGVTALMIAAKFEEIHPPQIKEYVYVTDKAYSQADIIKMEVCMLKALQFKLCCPTATHFLDSYQGVNGCSDTHRDLALYLLELTLVDYKMLKYAPSHLAAASILLSNKLLREPTWTPAMARHTKLTEPMLKDCAKEMCALLECAEKSPLQAVRRKFSQSKYHSVAKLNFTGGPDC